jgi:hypothetical protein
MLRQLREDPAYKISMRIEHDCAFAVLQCLGR